MKPNWVGTPTAPRAEIWTISSTDCVQEPERIKELGRSKPGRTKRMRPDRTALMKLADAYRCGHCWSEVGTGYDAVTGIEMVWVGHDDGCPVLLGALSDVPDTLRAAEAVDGIVIADADGRVIATLCPKDGAG